MKKILLMFFPLLLILQVQAQQPQLIQERNYLQGSTSRQVYCSAPDQYGNILYSGLSFFAVRTFRNNFLLVKPNTDTLWTRKESTNFGADYQALGSTADGKFYFAAPSKHPQIGAVTGLYLQKLSAAGQTLLSQNNYFNNTTNVPTSLVGLPDKSVVVGGGFQNKSYSLICVDSAGNFKWQKDYTRSGYDILTDMQLTPNGNIITAGMTAKPVGPSHFKLLLLGQNGDSILGKQVITGGLNQFEGMYSDVNSITPLSNGGFLLTGIIDTVSAARPNGTSMGMVVKVDANLNLQWRYVYRNAAVDEYAFSKVKELTDGSLLVLGFKLQPTQGGNGFQFYRFSPQGSLMAVYPFTSNICTQVWGVTFDALSDSTYLVGGRCGNNPPVTYGFYVAKVKIPSLPLPKPPFTITGISKDLASSGFTLGQSYPNPATESAIIPFNLPNIYKQATILIRDITGREVGTYKIRKNSSSLEVRLNNFSNGLYTYTLLVDEKPIATKKLVVMK
jgi:hypothetical protein